MRKNLSVNHYICGDALEFPAFAAAVRTAGIESVGLTRASLAEMGPAALENCLAENGLSVSSLNSAGYFTDIDPNTVKMSDEALIDAAARLKAEVLCVITGGLGAPPLPVAEAHERVKDSLGPLAERAATAGVTLGLEPIFPGDILTKGCINSCAHGLDVVAPYENAKLIIDLYHSWWDRDLLPTLETRRNKVALIQLCNIRSENGAVQGRDTLLAGDLDLSRTLPPVLRADYTGKLELELFDRDLRGRDPIDIVNRFPADLHAIFGI